MPRTSRGNGAPRRNASRRCPRSWRGPSPRAPRDRRRERVSSPSSRSPRSFSASRGSPRPRRGRARRARRTARSGGRSRFASRPVARDAGGGRRGVARRARRLRRVVSRARRRAALGAMGARTRAHHRRRHLAEIRTRTRTRRRRRRFRFRFRFRFRVGASGDIRSPRLGAYVRVGVPPAPADASTFDGSDASRETDDGAPAATRAVREWRRARVKLAVQILVLAERVAGSKSGGGVARFFAR